MYFTVDENQNLEKTAEYQVKSRARILVNIDKRILVFDENGYYLGRPDDDPLAGHFLIESHKKENREQTIVL